MPNNDAIRSAMERGLISSDITLARLIEADAAIGAIDGAASGDIGIGPMLVFRASSILKPVTQEHVDALANSGLIKPDITLAELVESAGTGDLINGAAELVGPWFMLRQMPKLDAADVLPQ